MLKVHTTKTEQLINVKGTYNIKQLINVNVTYNINSWS